MKMIFFVSIYAEVLHFQRFLMRFPNLIIYAWMRLFEGGSRSGRLYTDTA